MKQLKRPILLELLAQLVRSLIERRGVDTKFLLGGPDPLQVFNVIHRGIVGFTKSDDSEPVYDSADLYYYGLSNGHILGATFLALSDIEATALGAGGAAYTLIMFRSANFVAFSFLLESVYEGSVNKQKWASLAQIGMDRIDPITYAPYVIERPLPGGATARRVLMQTGIGDPAVPSVAAHLHARSLGIPLLTPAARPVPGLIEAPFPSESGLIEVDYHIADPLPGSVADFPVANSVHDDVRVTDPTLRQLDAFFVPGGTIVQTCDGACDPE